MTRRVLALTILLGVLMAPLASEAQQVQVARIGYVGNGTPTTGRPMLEAFRQGLRALGWIEGQTVTIEYRWAEDAHRLPALLTDLVQVQPNVIVVSGAPAIRAARAATRAIPVVFVMLADPIAPGFAASLARPGGNSTGLASQFEELITKQLQLLKEAVPSISRVALLHHADIPPTVPVAAETAARELGLAAKTLKVADAGEFEGAFRTVRSERAGAVHVLPSPFFNAHRGRLIELAAKYRLPAFYEFREFVDDGGLMSYGPSITDMFQRMASYVDRILKGAKPGDLPIERATKFELVINLKTAKALGLTIPQSILARADQIIQP